MPMQYRRLGASGLKVSELSLGSWITYHTQVDVTAAKEMLAAAMDAGVNFFDNAEVYARGQSEVVMGEGPIRHTGEFEIHVHLHADVHTTVKVTVAAED